ncbi:signal recognition particle subunit SRP19 [Nematocida homosporus]|uniref:signal recognition particle subunit SRP19 n=1 Tax=Nematocida homosporus TaxID=1912981 RepID=UPI00221E8761|nr:signal recognition particle subunit SRP19 [Nematocida homosporus]KAI5188062.1 signal recognition particle subunit SRP19 [Nematocida homosporus]
MSETIKIYPVYFNTRVARSDGRKVPYIENGVVPTLQQIAKALTQLELKYTTETKTHPKQNITLSGKFLPKDAKIEEIERHHQAVCGSLLVVCPKSADLPTKRSIIKQVHAILNK